MGFSSSFKERVREMIPKTYEAICDFARAVSRFFRALDDAIQDDRRKRDDQAPSDKAK